MQVGSSPEETKGFVRRGIRTPAQIRGPEYSCNGKRAYS